ncbi:MAG: hypothetical protein Rubg2KO_19780 [Rubricoccaceae bacterium]
MRDPSEPLNPAPVNRGVADDVVDNASRSSLREALVGLAVSPPARKAPHEDPRGICRLLNLYDLLIQPADVLGPQLVLPRHEISQNGPPGIPGRLRMRNDSRH